jgi:hypothetical protein
MKPICQIEYISYTAANASGASESDLVRDVERIVVWSQANIRLLCPVGPADHPISEPSFRIAERDIPDQGVDLSSLDIIQSLDRILDLALVRPDVDDEHERVVVLDLLHRALRVQRRDDRPVGIHTRGMGNALSWVLGRTGKTEGVRAVEGHGEALLAL